jgi:flagellar basal body-associated protein FliL
MLIFGSETEERLVAMAEQDNGFNKSLILIVAILLIILAGGASYFYTTSQNATVPTNSTMTTSSSAIATITPGAAMTSENMTMSTSTNATTLNTTTNATTNLSAMIQQNATTQDYRVTLQLGPPVQMLSMNQTATATMGDVIVNGQMPNSTSMNMTDTYHLEVHVYNITSGAVVVNQSVSIQIVNQTTNRTLTVPIIIMYDMKIGPSDTNFGNNITLPPGSYTIIVTIAGETAKFNINVTNQ